MYDTLLILAAVVFVPLLFLVVRAAFAWRYERLVQDSMREGSAAPAEPATAPVRVGRPPLTLAYVRPGEVRPTDGGRSLAADASAISGGVARAVIAAAVVYVVIMWAGMFASFEPHIPFDGKVVANYLLLAPVLLIVGSVLSLPPSRGAAVATAYVLAGMLLLTPLVGARRMVTLLNGELELFLIVPIAGIALLVLRRLRRLLIALAAVAIYLLITAVMGVVLLELDINPGEVRWWVWPLGLLNTVLGFVLFAWLLGRQSVRVPVAALAAAAFVGALIEWRWSPDFPVGPMLVGVGANVLQVSVLWGIFRVFVWFQDRHLLPVQLLHAHMLFGFFTAYLVSLVYMARDASLFGERPEPLIAIAAAFACEAATLHVLLRRTWVERRPRPGRRLLLLRAFGQVKGRERLLDALENTWRRVGRIDLIGAADLAMQTLGARMLEAFLLQRVEKQFLKTEEDVVQRLGQLRSALEGDVRYPINEIYCQGTTWQLAVRELAACADAVLMDLRGFTIANKGCAYELGELVRRVRLRRIVLLADDTTDTQALEAVAGAAWLHAPAGSANEGDPWPQLTVLQAGVRAGDSNALAAMVFDAAADSARDVASWADGPSV